MYATLNINYFVSKATYRLNTGIGLSKDSMMVEWQRCLKTVDLFTKLVRGRMKGGRFFESKY